MPCSELHLLLRGGYQARAARGGQEEGRPDQRDLVEADFLWHEPSAEVGREQAEPLAEVHLLVEGRLHPEAQGEVLERWLDSRSGRLLRD